jgi:hypothetical protein
LTIDENKAIGTVVGDLLWLKKIEGVDLTLVDGVDADDNALF